MDKTVLRRRMKEVRALLPSALREQEEKKMQELLYASAFYQNTRILFSYVSSQSEADTKAIISHAFSCGKRVAVPKVIGPSLMEFYEIYSLTDLIHGAYGLLEPVTGKKIELPNEKQLMLVPGLAFDYEGGRLGYGGGFYDRYLNLHKDAFVTAALCYKEQLIEKVPVNSNDISMDCLIMPSGIYDRRNEN